MHRLRHRGGDRRADLGDQARGRTEVLPDDALCGRPGERGLTRQHLVGDAAEGVAVGPAIEVLLARGLFRAHVVRSADRHPGLGERMASGRAHRARDPEVGHHRVAILEQDVLRLDVAVDHPLAVGVRQRVGHFAGESEGVLKGKLLLAVEPVAEGLPFDVRHHVVQVGAGLVRPVRGPRVIQRQDVSVPKVGRDRDLAQEAFVAHRGRELRPQDLDGHHPAVPEVLREIDGGHPALSKFALDPVVVSERVCEARDISAQCALGRLSNQLSVTTRSCAAPTIGWSIRKVWPSGLTS